MGATVTWKETILVTILVGAFIMLVVCGIVLGFNTGQYHGAVNAHTGAWTVHEWTDAKGEVHYIVEKARAQECPVPTRPGERREGVR